MTKSRRNVPKRVWDDPVYKKRRAALMASIGPNTLCGRCGRRLEEHPPHKSGKPPSWQCGHVRDGDNSGPLRAEVSTCNQVAGAREGHYRAFGRHRDAAAAPRVVGNHHPMHFNLTDPASVGAAPCLKYTGTLCDVCRDWHARN